MKETEISNTPETQALNIPVIMHSCYDCKYYQYEYNDGTLQPADPFCENTLRWIKNISI